MFAMAMVIKGMMHWEVNVIVICIMRLGLVCFMAIFWC